MHGENHPERERLQAIMEMVDELASIELVALRERLGPLCLWCGAAADRLCDGAVYAERRETCDAPVCSNCSRSSTVRGHVCTEFGHEVLVDTIDYCPFCVGRYAARERALPREQHTGAVRMHAAAAQESHK